MAAINLKLLQMFLLVAEHNSFRQAAERAHRSQSAVSTQIKHLEGQLGVVLFHRTTRRVRLTAVGEQLLVCAQRAINEVQLGLRMIQEAVDISKGRISLACSPTIAATRLPRILAAFERDYPGIKVFVRELPQKIIYETVRNGEADFGVGPLIAHADFSLEPVLDDEIFALVPRRFVKEERANISLESLAKLPLLLLDNTTALRALIEGALKGSKLELTTRYQFTQAQTLISMADAGLGAAVLPKSVLPKSPAPTVQILRIISPRLCRQIAIITNRGQALSPAAGRLCEHVRKLIDPSAGELSGRKRSGSSSKRQAAN